MEDFALNLWGLCCLWMDSVSIPVGIEMKHCIINHSNTNLFKNILLMSIHFLRDRERVRVGEGQRERETQTRKQALGSELSAQSPTQGSNPQTVRS